MKREFRRWHRYAGFVASVSVVVLVLTGILLNHSTSLQLAKRHFHQPSLLAWYGIDEPELAAWRHEDTVFIHDGIDLYANQQRLGPCRSLSRLLEQSGEIHADCNSQWLVMDTQGRLLETLEGGMQPALSATDALPLAAIAVDDAWRSSILQQSRTYRINAERLLLDIHSGRIFGPYGPWLVDIAALLLLGLAVSGLVLGLRR